jgi:uncharacterized protein YecT (DUF1311 family)
MSEKGGLRSASRTVEAKRQHHNSDLHTTMIRTFLACLALLSSFPSTSHGQSQRNLNARASGAFHRADSTLNVVYDQLVTRYRADSTALRRLRAAQRAWLTFRDAQVDASFPALDQQKAYGSVLPMCVAYLMAELTQARIAQLRRALRTQEGDVCAGGPG